MAPRRPGRRRSLGRGRGRTWRADSGWEASLLARGREAVLAERWFEVGGGLM